MEKFADKVFLNGEVITVNQNDDIAEALATKGNKIIFIGKQEDVRQYINENTQIIDLGGRSLVPGFIDSHLHMAVCGANELAIDCRYPGVKSIEDIKEKIKNVAEKTPKGQWIRGWGYDQSKLTEGRHPNCWDLDEVAPDHPVMLTRVCSHISVHNSKSLEIAGIEADTPSPEGGLIERKDGIPNGVMMENAHMYMMKVAQLTAEELEQALETANQKLICEGITSVHDSGGYGAAQMYVFQKSVKEKRINVRINMMLFSFIENIKFIEDFLKTGLYTNFGDERLKIGPLKIMIDGSSSGPTAATFKPYAIDPENYGILSMTREQVDEIICKAHLAGFQVTAHAVGDHAVDIMVGAIEKALKIKPKKDHRHRIEHCAMIDDGLLERIKAAGIVPVPQPVFLYEFGDGYYTNYGKERADRMFACASYIKGGIIAAGSSDCPITYSNPMLGIEMAVNRITQSGKAISQDERISVMDALRLFTYNGAYASFEENIKGSLEVGKLADMVVLSESLLNANTKEISKINVEMTVIDGEIVYQKSTK